MENLVGFVLPPVIALINSKVTNSTLRFSLSVLISLIVAIVVNFPKLSVSTPEQLLSSAGLLFTEAQVAYRLYWHEDSPVRQMLGK